MANVSIADQARTNMLDELVLEEPQLKSNVDLMREVIADVTQTLITVTSASAAVQYVRYLMTLRT
jgi:hypothetical protein